MRVFEIIRTIQHAYSGESNKTQGRQPGAFRTKRIAFKKKQPSEGHQNISLRQSYDLECDLYFYKRVRSPTSPLKNYQKTTQILNILIISIIWQIASIYLNY